MQISEPMILPSGPFPHPRPAIRRILLWALAGGAMLLAAGPAAAETLQDAIAAAYARYPLLARQRFLQKSLNESYVQTRSEYGPTLSVQGGASYADERSYVDGTLRGRQDGDAGQATLTLRQPLYTGGRLRGAVAAARADVLEGQQRLRAVEAETIQNVIIVYAGVLRDQQRVNVARENVAVLQSQLRENRARRRVEDVTLTDVAQADARLAAAETQLAGLESTLAISRGQFVQVVGHEPVLLAPLPDLPGMPGTPDQAYAIAETGNPTLAATRFAEQASSANVAFVRGEGKPSVALSLQGGYSGALSAIDTRTYRRNLTAGVTVTQSLFASGAIRSRIRQAQNVNDADQVSIDQARREAFQDVTAAWSQLAAARIGLSSGVRQVTSAQIAFAGMQREQRFGLRTTIEVLNAEQELQNAQLTLLQNRYSEYVARAALLATIGRLEARYVAPDIARYDAEQDFRSVRNRGRTPLEPIAQALDRIGSAGLRRPIDQILVGADKGPPDAVPVLPPTPGAELTRGPLVPITQSPLVPASALPGDHMPATGYLPPQPAPVSVPGGGS
jgi:TolC family type I secretion outer membrane protein